MEDDDRRLLIERAKLAELTADIVKRLAGWVREAEGGAAFLAQQAKALGDRQSEFVLGPTRAALFEAIDALDPVSGGSRARPRSERSTPEEPPRRDPVPKPVSGAARGRTLGLKKR